MSKTIKVGVAGAGYILESHADALKLVPGIELSMVADASSGRARAAADRFGFAAAVDNLDALARSDCDAVHILLPPGLHFPAARQMLLAGKDVLLEKPMTVSALDGVELVRLAKASGRRLAVSHNFLFMPAYENLRAKVRRHELGPIDTLQLNWHFELPQLQHGPFDIWMLQEPGNVLLELGTHLAAFAYDLLGPVDLVQAVAGEPIQLPLGPVHSNWTILATGRGARVLLSIDTRPGYPDRALHLRGKAGAAQIDFGRGNGWISKVQDANPINDARGSANEIAKQLREAAGRDYLRRLRYAVSKDPRANPFEESITRSIAAFYADQPDERHDPALACQVVALLEAAIAQTVPQRPPAQRKRASLRPVAHPDVLVVGGTGFIGKSLVRALVERGLGVRVLTRNRRAAELVFDGLAVDIVEGSHGNPETMRRALAGVRHVVHLAKAEGKRWSDYVEQDLEPTRLLGALAVDAGVERIVYTGTIDSYASGNRRAVIDNSTPLDRQIASRNHYARAKAAGEDILRAAVLGSKTELVVVRPGIVIGSGNPPAHLGVARFHGMSSVEFWGDGENALPFVLVDDVADGIICAMHEPSAAGKSYLLTGRPLLTAKQYVDEVSRYSGTAIRAVGRSAVRSWLSDLIKQSVKTLIRHPNRRKSRLRDWRAKGHAAQYDATNTERELNWRPEADRGELINKGIKAAVLHFDQTSKT